MSRTRNFRSRCMSTTEWEVSIIGTQNGQVRSDKTSRYLPLWAAGQELLESEPPRPPLFVAEYYVLSNFKINQLVPCSMFNDLWQRLSDDEKENFTKAHVKERLQYEKALKKLSKTLPSQEYIGLVEKYNQSVIVDYAGK